MLKLKQKPTTSISNNKNYLSQSIPTVKSINIESRLSSSSQSSIIGNDNKMNNSSKVY